MSEPSEIQLDPRYIDTLEGSAGPLAAIFDRPRGGHQMPDEVDETVLGYQRAATEAWRKEDRKNREAPGHYGTLPESSGSERP